MGWHWDWSGADRAFQKALSLNPNSVDPHEHHAYLLSMMGRFPEAIAEITRACALDPLNSRLESTFGRILFRARRYREAASQYQRALELDSHNGSAYLRLANV